MQVPEKLAPLPELAFSEAQIDNVVQRSPMLQEILTSQSISDGPVECCPDAMTAVPLAITPNVSKLEMTLDDNSIRPAFDIFGATPHQGEMFIVKLIRLATQEAPFPSHQLFGNLTDVHLCRYGPNCAGWDFSIVLLFLSIPSMRRLASIGCRTYNFEGPSSHGSSNVEDLTFMEHTVFESAIQSALTMCKALTRFTSVKNCTGCASHEHAFDYSRVQPELLLHQNSLGYLRLQSDDHAIHDYDDWHFDSRIGVLSEMYALNELVLDHFVLYGVDDSTALPLSAILPPGLK